MKNFLKITAALALLALPLVASAQRGFDTFYPTRTLILTPPATVSAATSVTNMPVDIRMFDGIVTVIFTAVTNGGGTLTATLEQSSSTNVSTWSALSGYALASQKDIIYTNAAYNTGGSTNMVATNFCQLPGALTTPTSATAGFSTTYMTTADMTNTGAITMPTNGVAVVGFNAGDQKRYLHVVWTQTGASSSSQVGAVLNGFTHGSINVSP